MKNDIDLTKIYDGEQLLGVLNFNNMVPVADHYLTPVDMIIRPGEPPAVRQYKTLLMKQLTWCQRNQEAIVKKANKLYSMMRSGKANASLRKRCCDFEKLERILAKRLESE